MFITTCMVCGDIIELDPKYGWEKEDEGCRFVICDYCLEVEDEN